MANHKTGSQRYNDRMDKIFNKAKATMASTKDGKKTYDTRYWKEDKKGAIVKVLDKHSVGDKINKSLHSIKDKTQKLKELMK